MAALARLARRPIRFAACVLVGEIGQVVVLTGLEVVLAVDQVVEQHGQRPDWREIGRIDQGRLIGRRPRVGRGGDQGMGRHRGARPGRQLPPEVSGRGLLPSRPRLELVCAGPRRGMCVALSLTAAVGGSPEQRQHPLGRRQLRHSVLAGDHQSIQVAAIVALWVMNVIVAWLGGGRHGVADRRVQGEAIRQVDRLPAPRLSSPDSRSRSAEALSLCSASARRALGARIAKTAVASEFRLFACSAESAARAKEGVGNGQGTHLPAIQLGAHEREDLSLVGNERRNHRGRIGRKFRPHYP